MHKLNGGRRRPLGRAGILFVLFLFLVLWGCSHGGTAEDGSFGGADGNRLYVVSWNVQTFFDAETSGLEYSEFRGSKSKWSRELYERRLDRLADAIEQLDADVLVLQEIENVAVMYDISNRLAGRLRGDDAYGWMCFAAEEDASIGCGVFSRLPLGKKRVHQVDCRVRGDQPQLRPLLEVEVLTEDSSADGEVAGTASSAGAVSLFVCHWKSKSGGEAEADFWQGEQERLLEWRLRQVVGSPLGTGRAIICGDFNRDLQEFSAAAEGELLLGAVAARNGWLHPATTSPGSYWYQDDWERIDHIFTAGAAKIEGFEARTDGPWVQVSETGQLLPHRYTMWQDAGYSDHLPVGCTVSF